MKVSAIVAIGKGRQIGLADRIPWHIPSDLKNFKAFTMGHHLLMGRVTFETLGRGLPGRKMLILSKNKDLVVSYGVLVSTLAEALAVAHNGQDTELFIGGGEKIYELALPYCHRLYISQVDYDGPADTYFPKYEHLDWKVIEKKEFSACEKHPAWSFSILERNDMKSVLN
ncbi:MAG: dihydrofolate reductase [Pseudomonadota bacterium]